MIVRLIAYIVPLAFFLPPIGYAADFTVNPVTIPLETKQKTSVLTVKNHAEEKLTLQVSAFTWSQDKEGNDVYAETGDVIVFPKIFSMKKGEERIVRIGIKTPAQPREKTYRIYLEEVPASADHAEAGAVVRTLMKVGVPIFVAPLKASPEGKIDTSSLRAGSLSFSVANTGNLRFIVRSAKILGLDESGTSIFGTELTGWYILQGGTKTFTVTVPRDICTRMAGLKIEVSTDILSLRESLNVRPEMCSP